MDTNLWNDKIIDAWVDRLTRGTVLALQDQHGKTIFRDRLREIAPELIQNFSQKKYDIKLMNKLNKLYKDIKIPAQTKKLQKNIESLVKDAPKEFAKINNLKYAQNYYTSDERIAGYISKMYIEQTGILSSSPMSKGMIKNIISNVRDGVEGGKQRNEIIADFLKKYPEIVENGFIKNASVLADSVITNARSYSALEAMRDSGIDYYQFVAIIDERTTPMCRSLHKRVFNVKNSISTMEKAAPYTLRKLKAYRPWGSSKTNTDGETEIYVKDKLLATKDINNDKYFFHKNPEDVNMVIPPIHAYCRSSIEPVVSKDYYKNIIKKGIKAFPIGTIRRWRDNKEYKKVAAGQWVLHDIKTGGKRNYPTPDVFLNKLHDLPEHYKTYKQLLEFSRLIKAAGGKVLLVGGCVRDAFMKKISKDFDVEVYGVDSETIEHAMKVMGAKASLVGKAFGVYKMGVEGTSMDIDVAQPRREIKTGEGHKGFDVTVDPSMTVEEAARRRDFTFNAILADPLTGELHDPFNGQEDINNRILKIVDPQTFIEDPLRVYRAMQFIGRFDLTVDSESLHFMQTMKDMLEELPGERKLEEFRKLFTKSTNVVNSLEFAYDAGILDEFEELKKLRGTLQDAKYHPEGDAWVHTKLTTQAMNEICKRDKVDNNEKMVLMTAAFLHDIGKPEVTEYSDTGITSHGHEEAGVKYAEDFLNRLKYDNQSKEKIVKLVAEHLKPTLLYIDRDNVSDGAIRKLAKRLYPATIKELCQINEADNNGRNAKEDNEAARWLLERSEQLNVVEKPAEATLQGRDLIEAGHKPGREFSSIIKLAEELHNEKMWSRDEILKIVSTYKTLKDIEDKIKEELVKSIKAYPIGIVKEWRDGEKYIKVSKDVWRSIKCT